eukprot:TRINITY_DN6929_c0_g1_i1.p2 TRINITY_DN6929_c0_g1~~TRINITY_DN6929_c0_g1_i1.p2  ORF type:complete len:202 (+),score=45.35 TRINITY_DN6929_c0_g1_i1:41-646(+)
MPYVTPSDARGGKPWPDPLWIFGYGSLTWKVDFEYAEVEDGYIEGHQRRFWQASTDHRGTHEFPGRVVTLAPGNERVWGKVYRIAAGDVDAVMAHLDYREKGGYTMKELDVHVPKLDNRTVTALVYTGTPASEEWVGETEDEEQIARVIAQAHGPSGPNSVYLFNLAAAVAVIAPDETDDHLVNLVHKVKEFQSAATVVAT